jgi:Carboxypeptidase regulatory-like domain
MRVYFVVSLLALGLCFRAEAQLANTTALVGTVVDSVGAAVAGASISAVNTATQDTYKTQTNGDGYYTIQFVRVGSYRITVEQAGFTSVTKTGITVDANQTVRNDFTLNVGQVNQNIEVSASTPPLATDEASLKEVIAQRSVADLPLNGRDPLQLAVTTPGVLPGQKSANGVPPGEDFIGAGTREIQNSVSLDGISIMNNLITTTPYHPSVDAIQEFEVQTGTYSAQYGAYLGAHLNLVSKSGTNDLHGALFEFFRNDKLDARSFFEKPTQPKVPLRQNQFGFELGGPVFIPHLYDGRNKTFFMADYEGLRLVKSITALDTVLTPAMRAGDFSALLPKTVIDDPTTKAPFAGNIIPTARLSPQALNVLKYMPLPNANGISNNLNASYPNNDSFNQTIDRLDQNIGDKIRLFFRYAWQNENILTGATSPYNATTLPVQTRNWVVGYTQTISPTMVNDFRIGRQHLVTDALNYWYVNNLKDAGTQLGIPGFNGDTLFNNPGIPVFNIGGYMSLGNAGANWFQGDTTWQGTDSFTWTHGAHTIIGGAELRKLITYRAANNNPQGVFTFSNNEFTGYSAADLMLGLPINDTTPGTEFNNKVAEWRDGFFVVDNWQARKNLTLNLGLRYELPTVPYTVNGFATILNQSQTAIIPANAPQPGFQFIGPNHKDFAPRLGFAYRATDKTVVRGGYGIYYNPNQTNTFTFLSLNPPFSNTITYNATAGNPTLSLANPTPASSQGKRVPPNVITPNYNLPTAYMNQWSFDVEQAVWTNAALDVQYLGSRSVHLDRSYYNNTPLPGPGSVSARRPNQLFGDIRTIQNDEVATYNGLSVVLRQRLNHGLSMLASYTWSHTLDVTTDSNGGGTPMNPYNWGADYGNSNWDVTHRFVASFNYELPFFAQAANGFVRQTLGGWQTNGIVTVQTGFPFNVTISPDRANTGRSNQRPNVVATPTANCGGGHLIGCIDSAAFVLPVQYTYGDFGRNVLFGPGLSNVDFSLFKNFSIRERAQVQFRSEFFNFFNTPNFNNPNTTFGTANFGTISSTSHDNREIQFALKLLF